MAAVLLPVYNRQPIAFARGEGCSLYTEAGERYLDFGSGVAVNALGYNHPQLVAALTAQAQRLWHVSNIFEDPGQQRLAERFIAASFAEVLFFCNSGAEANELAIKMARKFHAVTGHPERIRIITFGGAFHGRTLATLAASGQAKYLEGFGPVVQGFDQASVGDEAALREMIGPETAAIMIEPVQGEGGVRLVPFEFMRLLRSLADELGLLLILDEVQCGMGRTGKLFAHEWSGVTPDIVTAAKGIGGGFPLGACLATAHAAQGMTAGTHGCTFGGNPLATAVGNAVLDVMLEPGFLDTVQHNALYLKQKLARLIDEHKDCLEEVRGLGLHTGLKCRVPVADAVKAALAQGLITIAAGDNVMRVVPPLIVSPAEIDEAVTKLDRAFATLNRKAA